MEETKTQDAQCEALAKPPAFSFPVTLNAAELWKFSMYHANKGYLGVFNVLFTIAAVYLLITQWAVVSGPYRVLLVMCVLMFTVWQPGTLYLKAKRQAQAPAVREPMVLSFGDDGVMKKLLEENEEIKRQTTEKKQAAVLKVEQHLCKIRQNLGIQKNQPDYPAEENRRQTADNRLNFRTNGGEFGDRQTTR